MTKIPGTLDSAQNDGHQAFQVPTSTWSINIKWAEVANYSIKTKKQL